MNDIVRPSLLLLFAISSLNAAELPKRAFPTRYAPLWENSPFTTKRIPPPEGPALNPFGDWALKGVAPIAGGYLITLLNRKNPAEPVPHIDTDKPSEFQVLSVERDPGNPMGTVVYLQKGDMKGSVTYDAKLSVLTSQKKQGPKPPAGPTPTGVQRQLQIGTTLVAPTRPVTPAPTGPRQIRSRVVSPSQ